MGQPILSPGKKLTGGNSGLLHRYHTFKEIDHEIISTVIALEMHMGPNKFVQMMILDLP